MLFLSTTSYSEASRCLKLFDYHQRQRLVVRPKDVPRRMRAGVWIHRALQHEDDGSTWEAGLQECVDWARAHGIEDEQITAIHDECFRILSGYYAYWDQHHRWQWQVISCEEPIEVQLSPALRVRATVDKIVKWRGKLWLVEHKSTSDIPSAAWRAIDPQTALQYAVCELSGKYRIEGIIFDYLVTREPPVPRVKNDGRFYAGTEKQTTTAAAFDSCLQEVSAKWKHDETCGEQAPEEFVHDGQVCSTMTTEAMRDKIVNDGHFFQRFEVYRPLEAIQQTLRDVRATAEMIAVSGRLGHWRRLNDKMYCQRFCMYATLCAAEYVSGKESSLRETDFMLEDPTDREGRDRVPQGNLLSASDSTSEGASLEAF